MRAKVVVVNGLLALSILGTLMLGARDKPSSVLASRSPELAALEEEVARSSAAPAVAKLLGSYVDVEQPGLASALLERVPDDVRAEPAVAIQEARVLVAQGHASQALGAARRAAAACAHEAACPAWVAAKATRQQAFLEALVGAGIEDVQADPGGARVALERSDREVRLVAMR